MHDFSTQAQVRSRMVEVLQSFLDGHTPRSAIVSFTREVWPDMSRQGGPFMKDGTASSVFDSIWNVEERYGEEYLLRESDLRDYLRWLTEGDPLSEARNRVWVRRSATEVAALPGSRDTRFWMDGLGWFLSVELRSPKTGRIFVAVGPMDFDKPMRGAAVHATGELDHGMMEDLLETFALARDEVIEAED